MRKKIITSLISLSFFFTLATAPVFAQNQLGCDSNGKGNGFGIIADFLCQNHSNEDVGTTLNKVISGVIGFMTMIAALWFIFQFITAGFQWIAAGGDKNETTAARDKITNSLIGLVVIVIAWAVVGVIGTMLGLSILNPGSVLLNLHL